LTVCTPALRIAISSAVSEIRVEQVSREMQAPDAE